MLLKGQTSYRFGDFRIDARERLLWRGETLVPIAPKAFDALLILIDNAGALVGRAMLRDRLWPGQIVEDGTIARLIADVRKALGDLGEERQYIETVPKFGYRFVGFVEAESQLPVSQPADPPAAPQPPSRGWNWKVVTVAVVVAALIAAAGLALDRTPKVESLLITPFQVIGQSPDIGILQLGLQDSLAMELSSLSYFSVIKVHEMPDDAAELGRRHRARFVLTGTVEPLSGRIHVSARLLRSADGQAIWTHSFDETMDEIFKVQSRLAALTVAELIPSLSPRERSLIERRQPANGAAYRYYLLGRYYWNKRDEGGNRLAVEMFQKAVQADSTYAPAYIGLADSFLLGARSNANLLTETLPSARAALEKAVQLDPGLGEAHASLGLIAGSYYFDWNREERELQTAIRLAPNYVTAHHWYAEFLTMMGKFEQSEAEFEVTRNLDPASAIVLTDLAQLQNFEKKYEQSLRTLDEVLKLDHSFSLAHERKAYALVLLRRPADAMAEFELAGRIGHRAKSPLIKAWVAAIAGEREQGLVFARQAEEQDDNALLLAVIWAELGDADRGMTWLERAYERRSSGLISVKVNPIFDPLRRSERFKALLRRMSLS
jgi:DNA-binding winged helix-turn-helix (wHTH) protein/TolB-like protein/Tfp pilus assembly protein PilF